MSSTGQRGRERSVDEAGMAGIEGLVFGTLLFVFGTLVIVGAWGVIDAKWATAAAAREAGRAYVEAADQDQAQRSASAAANAAIAGHRHALSSLTVSQASGGYTRCGSITVTATSRIPRLGLPVLDRVAGTYEVKAEHTEAIDPYRSGLVGVAVCTAP